MKKFCLSVVLLMGFASSAFSATIYYGRVTTYDDGTAISAAKIPTIIYKAYYGPSVTGPWTSGNTATDNAALTAPDPARGGTLWYTLDATLDGMTSIKAAAKSKTVPFQATQAPQINSIE
jgi:hypothetical protein